MNLLLVVAIWRLFLISSFLFALFNFILALVMLVPLNLLYYPLWFLSFQVVNDLLNPAGQNLRIREDAQVLYSFCDLTIIFINYCYANNNGYCHCFKCFDHIINLMPLHFMMHLISMVR